MFFQVKNNFNGENMTVKKKEEKNFLVDLKFFGLEKCQCST